jgi:hypothetical protein
VPPCTCCLKMPVGGPSQPASAVVVRTSHQAPDQKDQSAREHGWSVHGGDQFAAFAASQRNAESSRGTLKDQRRVSFSHDDERCSLPKFLQAPSIIRKRELPAPPPGATHEAVLLARPNGDDDLGFKVDAENVVLSVSAPRSVGSGQGCLQVGDRIVSVNGVLACAGGVLDLIPAGKGFTHFDIARTPHPSSAAADGACGTPLTSAKRTKSLGGSLYAFGQTLGAPAASMLRRNASSFNDVQALEATSSLDGSHVLPLVVSSAEALRTRFGEDNSVVGVWCGEPPLLPTGGNGPAARRSQHSKLHVGDQLIAVNGSRLRESEEAIEVLRAAHKARCGRKGGLAATAAAAEQSAALLLTVRRAMPAADAPEAARKGGGVLQALRAFEYRTRRSMDTSRTTLCTAGRELKSAHELAIDVHSLNIHG